MRILFFDTETTGGAEQDRLLQLGVKERGIAEPVVNAIYKPPVPISYDSMAIHHITEKMAADKPLFVQAPEYNELKQLFEGENTVMVAHNAAFDVGMMAREGIAPRNIICTYKVARALDPNELIGQYRLQYLRYVLGIDVEANAHDAWGDVLVLEALFERLLAKMMEQTAPLRQGSAGQGSEQAALDEMLAISARPMLFTTLRFGKHKGKKLEDIARADRGYLEWLLNQKKQEPVAEADWIHTLEHFLRR